MRRLNRFILVLLIGLVCAGCSAKESFHQEIAPNPAQMKSIFELATMKCYYHNVAKYSEDDATGAWWWKKDRQFWIEYAGIVTVGIDTSLVDIKVSEDEVTITLPPAKVLGCKVDENTLTPDSFIVASGSAKVEAEHQMEAFKEAQARMKEEASNDSVLLANAQQRAQKLLEDYVNNIGACVGKQYRINWIYLNDTEEVQDIETEKAVQEEE